MKYKTEKEISDLIENFENCTINRGDWGHPEHLIVAYHYASNNDYEIAYNKMKNGIFNLLRAFEVDLNKEMPYHETLTVFWMRTIFDFAKLNDCDSITNTVSKMINNFDKNYPLKFYSRERLFCDEARRDFLEPDIL